MPNPDAHRRLLDDLLNDDDLLAHREKVLGASRSYLRRRRRIRLLQRLAVPIAACVAMFFAVVYWRPFHRASSPAAVHGGGRSVAEARLRDRTIVSTQDIARLPSVDFEIFSTKQISLRLEYISDHELLACFTAGTAMLLRRGNSMELWVKENGRFHAVR